MMKEQHTLKMVVGYEVGKAFSRSAVFESSFLVWLRQAVLLPHQPLPPVYNIGATARGLAMFDLYNPRSVALALEMLSWGFFLGLATLFVALVFSGGKLEHWIRGHISRELSATEESS